MTTALDDDGLRPARSDRVVRPVRELLTMLAHPSTAAAGEPRLAVRPPRDAVEVRSRG